MLLKSILGSHQMWALSLLSIIPTLVTVHTMDDWCKQDIDASNRNIAKMMLLTCGLFLGMAIVVRMDMLMCMFIVLAMRSFWRREQWLFPIYLFLALFTKGPLGILIPLCATIAFLVICKQYRKIGQVWGWRTWTVLIAGCAAWWGLVYAEGGYEYLHNLLFHQTVDRAVHAFHHEHPFYFYMVCIWYCIAPWTIHIVTAFIMSLRKNTVRTPLHVFFLTATISTLVLLSCISGKLEVYMLPAYPFMVYATVMYFPRITNKTWARFCGETFISRCVLGIFIIAFVGGLCLPFINKYL